MFRRLLLSGMVALSVTPAIASPNIDDYGTLLATAYLCRDQLGGLAHYDAARSVTVDAFGRDPTIYEFIDHQREQMGNQKEDAPASACLKAITDIYYRIGRDRAIGTVNVMPAKMVAPTLNVIGGTGAK